MKSRTYFGLAIDPKSSNTIYAGSERSLYKSTDGGETWKDLANATNLQVTDILVDQGNSANVYLATYYGVFKSTDYGETWTEKTYDNTYSICQHSIDRTLYLTSSIGLNKSEDDGETWERFEEIPQNKLNEVKVTPDNFLFVSTSEYSILRKKISDSVSIYQNPVATPLQMNKLRITNKTNYLLFKCKLNKSILSSTVTIFNSFGKMIRSFKIKNGAANQLIFSWDGKTNNGSISGSGVYFITINNCINFKCCKLF